MYACVCVGGGGGGEGGCACLCECLWVRMLCCDYCNIFYFQEPSLMVITAAHYVCTCCELKRYTHTYMYFHTYLFPIHCEHAEEYIALVVIHCKGLLVMTRKIFISFQ